MAIEYGFFNSVSDDRLYNAETFNTYFEGLISRNGVFENVGNRLGVTAPGTDLTVVVNIGKALVNNHWVKLTAPETLTVATPHNIFSRYDRVVLRWNASSRDVTLHIVAGTPSSTPQRAAPARSESIYEIILAYVLVPANATKITTANLYDQRNNSAVCGFVTGLINQVNTTTLFAQYEARFAAMEERYYEWLNAQKDDFNAWYYNLTQELTVGAVIRHFRKTVVGGPGVSNVIPLNIDDYSYDNTDVIICNLNGLILIKDTDYTLVTNTTPAEIRLTQQQISTGNTFDILILKSNMTQTSDGYLTSATGAKLINVTDAMPGAVKSFIINTLGTTNEIVVTNRNLFRIDKLQNLETVSIMITKNDDGSFNVIGNGGLTSKIETTMDKNAFVPGYSYTLNSNTEDVGAAVEIELTYTDTTSETFSSIGEPITFDISKAVSSAICRIRTNSYNSVDITVSPQLEVGTEATEFRNNNYDTFVYDGSLKPIFTENTNNVYSTDDAVSDMQLIYTVDAAYIENGDLDEF